MWVIYWIMNDLYNTTVIDYARDDDALQVGDR